MSIMKLFRLGYIVAILLFNINAFSAIPTIAIFSAWEYPAYDISVISKKIARFAQKHDLKFVFQSKTTVEDLTSFVENEDLDILVLIWSGHGKQNGDLVDIKQKVVPKYLFDKIPTKYHLLLSACHPKDVAEKYHFNETNNDCWYTNTREKTYAADLEAVIDRFINDYNSKKINDVCFLRKNNRYGCSHGSVFIFTNQGNWNQVRRNNHTSNQKVCKSGGMKYSFKGVPEQIDTAFFLPSKDHCNRGYIYFFSNGTYYKYDTNVGTGGKVMQIGRIEDKWRGIPTKIDTAFSYEFDNSNSRRYVFFISGSKSYQFDPKKRKVVSRGTIDSHWPGLYEGIKKKQIERKVIKEEKDFKKENVKIDAAFFWPTHNSSSVYFISDGISYEWARNKVISARTFENDWSMLF